jgi:hypothetical protein
MRAAGSEAQHEIGDDPVDQRAYVVRFAIHRQHAGAHAASRGSRRRWANLATPRCTVSMKRWLWRTPSPVNTLRPAHRGERLRTRAPPW